MKVFTHASTLGLFTQWVSPALSVYGSLKGTVVEPGRNCVCEKWERERKGKYVTVLKPFLLVLNTLKNSSFLFFFGPRTLEVLH